MENVICISPIGTASAAYNDARPGRMFSFTLVNTKKVVIKPGQQVKLDLYVTVSCESSVTGTDAFFLIQNEAMTRTPIRLAQQCCPVYRPRHVRIVVDNIGKVPYTLDEHYGVIDVVMPNLTPFMVVMQPSH